MGFVTVVSITIALVAPWATKSVLDAAGPLAGWLGVGRDVRHGPCLGLAVHLHRHRRRRWRDSVPASDNAGSLRVRRHRLRADVSR